MASRGAVGVTPEDVIVHVLVVVVPFILLVLALATSFGAMIGAEGAQKLG